jgi:hypothetical protein
MEKLLLGILATIAGVLAIVLFGKPQSPTARQSDAPIGRVEPSTRQDEPSLDEPSLNEPTISESTPDEFNIRATESSPSTIPSSISTPVTTLPASSPTSDPQLDADAVLAARTDNRSLETIPIEPSAPQAVGLSAAPKAGLARSMPPFAAIQDPRRPSTPELQDLSQEIINLGRSQKRSNLPLLLQYRDHDNAMIRRYVAYAMGQLTSTSSQSDKQAIIPFLQELAQDADRDVQQMAQRILRNA